MTSMTALRGMTWNDSRGFLPLVATARHFMDRRPEIEISWEKRSLKDFGDFPIEQLVDSFDLLIIDHLFAGFAAAHDALVPLDALLPGEFIKDQAENCVGASHAGYELAGHLWALAIDATAPVSGWRPDLMERAGLDPPATWDDLLALARRRLVIAPAAPADSLMNLTMLCLALGEEPFASNVRVVSTETGVAALELLRELIDLCGPACIDLDPIRTWETLVASDAAVYCPFADGYPNYARDEYGPTKLKFGGLVSLNGVPLRSTLGGAGLAISRSCRYLQPALDYVQYVASPECQRTHYAAHGGQPGHRGAWLDPQLNTLTNDFFRDTLATHDQAFSRPRHYGYVQFQERAGDIVRDYLRDGGHPMQALERVNKTYRESRN